MKLEEAVKIYQECTDEETCDKCPLNDRQWHWDENICSLLNKAELRLDVVR